MSGKSVAIVGGGVIGLALAWRLADEGARVTLIDDPDVPAATQAAAGMLAPSFEMNGEASRGALAEPLYDLCLASLKRWPAFAARLEAATGVSVDFRPDGVMGLAFDAAVAAEFADVAAGIAMRGGNVRILNRARAIEREPSISPKVVAALWAPDDAQVDPRLLTVALRRAIKRSGGVLVDGRVREIARKVDGGLMVSTDEGATFLAEAVVVAAGVAASKIAMPAPVPPIYPVKGEALALQCEGRGPKCVVRAGAYLCPKADGRLVIGATVVPHATSLEPSADAIDALKAAAIAAAPSIAECPEIERWAGLRPATPDGAPVLGPDSRGPENLWFAVGHYRNGVLLAPETAALLAPAILKGKAPRSNPFRPDRFNGRFGASDPI